ncbi:MAG: AMP-binding protein [Pseudomonadota bacterium]|jgi:feruloyl-CoA synthase
MSPLTTSPGTAPPASPKDACVPCAKPFRKAHMPKFETLVERRADGTLLMRSAHAIGRAAQSTVSEFIAHWAAERGEQPVLCERDGTGQWRKLSWRDFWEQVQIAAAALLEMGLGQDKPLMVLSGNSIELAVLLYAAEHVGVPVAPVSPAYSLMSSDFSRLKAVAELVPPAAIFVQSAPAFARALAALGTAQVQVIAVSDAAPGQLAWSDFMQGGLTAARRERVAAAHAALAPTQVARILFTSGSTGAPKGVATTYEGVRYLVDFLSDIFGVLTALRPVYLDWLPWHHAFGLFVNLNRSLVTGGTHYIDDGRPVPGQFERTVRNLREVSPTLFNSVPTAWAMLVDALERDDELARSLFSKVVGLGYGGASLGHDVWQRLQRVAERTVGERIQFQTGLASTETAGAGTFNNEVGEDLGNIGLPSPGSQLKLVPLEGGDGRYEIRVRTPFAFGGYVRRPDLTQQAFDEEGFFCIGDAVRLADPADPARGLRFAGRVAEDFKLANGTWVRTGAVRMALVEQCAPLLNDAVICGHDQNYISALAWPHLGECRKLDPALAELDAAALALHPIVLDALAQRLGARGGNPSAQVQRLLLLAEPPSLDGNEIADKGYVNQAVTRARRAHLIPLLYANPATAQVVCVA